MLKVVRAKDEEAPAVAPSAMDRPVVAKRFKPGRIVMVAGLVVALGIGAFAYAKFGLSKSVTVDADRLAVSEVKTGLFRDYVPVTGAVAPIDTIYLDTPEGGQVVALLAEEGAMVRAGQPLVKLANTRLELEVIGREAQFNEQRNTLASLQLALTQNALEHRRAVDEAEYNVERVTADITRYRPLAERGYYPKAQLEDLERQLLYYQAQRATRLEAQAADKARMDQQLKEFRDSAGRLTESLGLVRGSLDNLTVTAPIDGQLTVLTAKPGQAIPPGQRIGQVDRIDAFKVTAKVDEFYLGRVAAGQRATAEIAGQPVSLRVTKVLPEVRERSFTAELSFEGAPPALRAGQTVQLRIELGEAPNSLIVGNGAFYEDSGGAWAFVVGPDGSSAERRTVRLGRRNPEAIEVLSGLKPGDRIITSSYANWRDMDRINIVGGAPAARRGTSQ